MWPFKKKVSWSFVCPECGATNKKYSLPHSRLCSRCYWDVMRQLKIQEENLKVEKAKSGIKDGWEGFECPVHGPYPECADPIAHPEKLCWTVIKCSDPCKRHERGESCVYCDHRIKPDGSNGWVG